MTFFKQTIRAIGVIFLMTYTNTLCSAETAYAELQRHYRYASYEEQSDICDHVPTLHDLAAQCTSVTEIGLRGMSSSWGIVAGLADNGRAQKHYLGIDIESPSEENLARFSRLTKGCGIQFRIWIQDDITVKMEPVEMLFIDTLHTYCHLTWELEAFSPQVTKFIAMHDTAAPFGYVDNDGYHGDHSEYPAWIDRKKQGLWTAVQDFLARHPEWKLKSHAFNRHGFTVLERCNTSPEGV